MKSLRIGCQLYLYTITLNVYTHNSYEKAEESMAQIVAFSGGQTKQENLRRFG